MSAAPNDSTLRHRHVDIGLGIHAVEGGSADRPAVVFLHGWPEDWSVFEAVMTSLAAGAHVLGLDLPGVGGSKTPPSSGDKRTLAKHVRGAIAALGLSDVTLVGHDVGGMIAYAYVHAYPGELARAVIMNTAIPGVEPWSEVVRNPHIWHFAFHAVPDLPELLITGHEAAYFDFFYNAISARPDNIQAATRHRFVQAYARPEALRTGFEWYRAFPQDERDNAATRAEPVDTPVLYLRGDHETGDVDAYVRGLRDSGLRSVTGGTLANSGHFAPIEAPTAVVTALRTFLHLDRAIAL